jgi:hypothetical protein
MLGRAGHTYTRWIWWMGLGCNLRNGPPRSNSPRTDLLLHAGRFGPVQVGARVHVRRARTRFPSLDDSTSYACYKSTTSCLHSVVANSKPTKNMHTLVLLRPATNDVAVKPPSLTCDQTNFTRFFFFLKKKCSCFIILCSVTSQFTHSTRNLIASHVDPT